MDENKIELSSKDQQTSNEIPLPKVQSIKTSDGKD